MKTIVQWAARNPQDWIEIDSSLWATLPSRAEPTPGQLGGSNNQLGWINGLMVQGVVFNGADHYAVEDVVIGLDAGVRVTSWWDDPDDYPVGERRARVWTILPLAPDPALGNAINTRQSQVVYAEGARFTNLEQNLPQNTSVRPWSEFVPPSAAITRHGVWLTDAKYAEHVATRREWGWRHWADHLPDGEINIDSLGRRRLKVQRELGRWRQASRTITYYQRDTDRAVGWAAGTIEDALELTTAAVVTESIPLDGGSGTFIFTTPANEPNSADWPIGTYRYQYDVTVASAGVTHGDVGTSLDFVRVSNDAATSLEGVDSATGSQSGVGLFLVTAIDWNPATGSAGDRLGIRVWCSGDSHGDAITIELNTADSYADGPWASGTTFFQTLPATVVGTAVIADIVSYFRTLIVTALAIASIGKLATFFRTLSAAAIGLAVLSKGMFIAFVATVLAIATLTPAALFTKILAATAISVATLSKVTTHFQTLAATALAIASLTKVATYFRALATVVLAVPALSKVATYFKTLVATAGGLATLTKTMFQTLVATVLVVVTLTPAILIAKALAATVLAVTSLGKATIFARTLATTAVGVMMLSRTAMYSRALVATAVGVVTLSTVSIYMRTLAAVATGTAILGRIATFVRTLATTAAGTPLLALATLITQLLAATVVGVVTLNKVGFIGRTLVATAIGTASLMKAAIFSRSLTVTVLASPVLATAALIARLLLATAAGIAILSRAAIFSRLLTATSVGVPLLIKGMFKLLSALVSALGSLVAVKIGGADTTEPINLEGSAVGSVVLSGDVGSFVLEGKVGSLALEGKVNSEVNI